MIVKAVDDINLKVISSDDRKQVGQFILQPNSVRRDVTFEYAPAKGQKMGIKPFDGRDLK